MLFRHDQIADPYALYRAWLHAQPVHYNADTQTWLVLSYQACSVVLNTLSAHIPDPNSAAALGETSALIAAHLVRLSNPPLHHRLRPLVEQVLRHIQPVAVAPLLANLCDRAGASFDWVAVVAKRLPALLILSGYGVDEAVSATLIERLPVLVTLMQPGKTPDALSTLEATAEEVLALIDTHVLTTPHLSHLVAGADAETRSMIAANLIGLLIQSYDAGRGLLSNVLTCAAAASALPADDFDLRAVELLRHDPPIHNTRRILTEPLVLEGVEIAAGERVVVMLAAANRDPAHFDRPDEFDPQRANNRDHLAFGDGIHACLAGHFMHALASATLRFLDQHRPALRLHETERAFEPLVNARLPRSLHISL